MITIERDPRTREILIRGPNDFAVSLEDNVIAAQSMLVVQRVLNEVYEAGRSNPSVPIAEPEAQEGKKAKKTPHAT